MVSTSRFLLPWCLLLCLLAPSLEAQPPPLIPEQTASVLLGDPVVPSPGGPRSNPVLGAAPLGTGLVIQNDPAYPESAPVAAYSPWLQQYLVVWYKNLTGDYAIQGRWVSKNGAFPGISFNIASGGGVERRNPAIAYNGDDRYFLVVWEEVESGRNKIFGAVISETGFIWPAFPISIHSGALKDCFYPKVAYSIISKKFMVVWERHLSGALSNDIEIQYVDRTGQLDGTNGIIAVGDNVNFSHQRPNLAFNAHRDEFLVVWERWYKPLSRPDIYGQLAPGAGGIFVLNNFPIVTGSYNSTRPAAAVLPWVSSLGQYLVVCECGNSLGLRDIFGKIVEGDGTINHSKYIYINNETVDNTGPVVVAHEAAQEFLVTYTRPYTTLPLYGVFGREISSTPAFKGPEKWIWGFLSGAAAAAKGPWGDSLIVYEEYDIVNGWGIWGALWGNRLYLPLILKP